MKIMKNHQPWTAFFVTGLVLASLTLAPARAQSTNATQAGGQTSSATTGTAKSQLMPTVNRMMDKLKAMRMTGDPDFDYVLLIRTHHLGEIELAQEAVKSLQNAGMKQLAQTLITRKQNEVNQLESALKQIKPSRANQAFVQSQNQKLEAMKLNFEQGTLEKKLAGNVDTDYAMIMLEHHRDAIDITQDYLQYGKNQTLRSLAQQILTNAKSDSDQLKAVMK
ncbi:DUF305 domain-containing protein [Nibrella saemangeumensis]